VLACPALNVCTIIAKNYAAYARVLARSLAETNPGSRLWTLVIDDFDGYLDPENEPFELLTPGEVQCDPFIHMAMRYSVLELSTAVQPWLLRHLMRKTGGPVTYLDPDIQVYGSLQELDELAERHRVVLIPHNSRPIPQDGRKPSQVDVMIAGIYNLGYVSLAPGKEVDDLLDWWADRLRRDCRVDPVWGYFVDQRWFDLAPGFVADLAIVRDPQYNLAYWNLHEHQLENGDGVYRVDGRPLAFFHYSGFDPEHPLVLSRHQNRIDVATHSVLERLLAEYAEGLMAEGHGTVRHWPYEFAALGDGTKPDDTLRDLWDVYADGHGDDVGSPFTLDGVRAFDRWLAAPAVDMPASVSRALAHVYAARDDLRAMFPDLSREADRDGLLDWARDLGKSDEPVLGRGAHGVPVPAGDARAVRAATPGVVSGVTAPAVEPLRDAPWGVNVIGDLCAGTELGQVARALVAALDSRGIRALPILSEISSDRARPYRTASAREAAFPVNVICIDPQGLPDLVRHAGTELFAGRYSIGLWWAAEVRASDGGTAVGASMLEEIWAPSRYVADALAGTEGIPVEVMPVPVRPERTGGGRAALGLPDDEIVFATRVDYREGFECNNPLAVIDAFRRAFPSGEAARLCVACAAAAAAPERHAAMTAAVGYDNRIALHDGDAPGVAEALTDACDVYVSLHRAQPFGLALAEAMWLGKPVIATDYSGNLEFMTQENSHLVRVDGADPDVAHAAQLMRQVAAHRAAAEALGARAAADIRRDHSIARAGEVIARRLESIRAVGVARRPANPLAGRSPSILALPMRLAHGPRPAAPGAGQAARERLRQAVLRVLRPFTTYQNAVNAEVVTALGDLSDRIGQVRDASNATRADILSLERRLDELGARRVDE
jgi:glycosyltransferase involved in cell wall biosynthesis